MTESRTTVVLTEIRDENGFMWRAVHLMADGRLVIEGCRRWRLP